MTDVVVLGAGITGLTTAITLQAIGCRVTILSEHIPKQAAGEVEAAGIATSFAMASAYPHNLRIKNLERISDDSQSVFKCLNESAQASGIAIHRLFEVYEQEPDAAPLADRRMNFQLFEGEPEQLRRDLDPPIRPGAQHLWGWVFDTYFADMPIYMPFLWSWFEERGGRFEIAGFVSPAQIIERTGSISGGSARTPVIINCLGLGAIKIFDDRSACNISRGRQAIALAAPAVTNAGGMPVAYNYTPSANVFSRGDGNPEYVHFFSRSDGWILGQTREPGHLTADGSWSGSAVRGEELLFGEQPLPQAIVDLNQQLLQEWLGLDLSQQQLRAREGYRYYRDPENTGVRLEAEEREGALFIHNYGHGGSGITMSWGCSLAAARLLKAHRQWQNTLPRSVHSSIDKVLLDLL